MLVNLGTKNLQVLYVGVPMAESIGLNGGCPSMVSLCIFGNPYMTPGLVPVGERRSYSFRVIAPDFRTLSSTFRTRLSALMT